MGLPPADIGLCGSSFRFCRVGPGWPTPIHVPGDRRRHDRADFLVQPILPCDRGGPWESHPGRCPVKDGVDSVNIYVCFLRRFCVVSRSNRCPSFRSAKCHPRSLGRSLRCCRTHHSRHTLTACAGRLSRNASILRRLGYETCRWVSEKEPAPEGGIAYRISWSLVGPEHDRVENGARLSHQVWIDRFVDMGHRDDSSLALQVDHPVGFVFILR